LAIIGAVLQVLDIDDLFRYPRVGMALLSLLKGICQNHADAMLRIGPEFLSSVIRVSLVAAHANQRGLRNIGFTTIEAVTGIMSDPESAQAAADVVAASREAVGQILTFAWNWLFSAPSDIYAVSKMLMHLLAVDNTSTGMVRGTVKGLLDAAVHAEFDAVFDECMGFVKLGIETGREGEVEKGLMILRKSADRAGLRVTFA